MRAILFLIMFFAYSLKGSRSQKTRGKVVNRMIFFNAFQLTVLFAAWPFIINWLASAQFQAHGVLYWVAIVAYVIHFGFNVFATGNTLDK